MSPTCGAPPSRLANGNTRDSSPRRPPSDRPPPTVALSARPAAHPCSPLYCAESPVCSALDCICLQPGGFKPRATVQPLATPPWMPVRRPDSYILTVEPLRTGHPAPRAPIRSPPQSRSGLTLTSRVEAGGKLMWTMALGMAVVLQGGGVAAEESDEGKSAVHVECPPDSSGEDCTADEAVVP